MIHNDTHLGAEKSKKEPEFWNCEKCDFSTSKNGNWQRHLKTIKHNDTQMIHNDTHLGAKKSQTTFVCICGLMYKHRSNYYRHKRACSAREPTHPVSTAEEMPSNNSRDGNISLAEHYAQIIDIKDHYIAKLEETVDKVIDKGVGGVNQAHNSNSFNTINNVHVFLTEKCSDAMSLSDFISQLKITMEDLRVAKDNSVKGIAQIVEKNLQPLALTNRPMHHISNDEWYVKNPEGWQGDSGEKVVNETRVGIQRKWPTVFTDGHPNWMENDKLSSEYVKMAGMATRELSDKETAAVKRTIGKKCGLTPQETD